MGGEGGVNCNLGSAGAGCTGRGPTTFCIVQDDLYIKIKQINKSYYVLLSLLIL